MSDREDFWLDVATRLETVAVDLEHDDVEAAGAELWNVSRMIQEEMQ